MKPYVKRQKNDAADAEAICEAVTRANMRFVETKTPEQQSCLMLHRTRHLFIRQRTSVINAIRAHLAEFGIVAPVGRHGVEALLEVVADVSDNRVPEVARACLAALGAQLRMLKAQILEFDRMIMAWHRSNETSRRLDAIPGIGPALATALVASVADPKAFRSGRNFSAWIGLVPKQHSSGGKDKLGSISKQGDRYLRSLFTAGALAVIRYAKIHGTQHRPWLTALLARRPTKVAAIALANKIAKLKALGSEPASIEPPEENNKDSACDRDRSSIYLHVVQVWPTRLGYLYFSYFPLQPNTLRAFRDIALGPNPRRSLFQPSLPKPVLFDYDPVVPFDYGVVVLFDYGPVVMPLVVAIPSFECLH